jgi:acetyl-CoA acetyltransferase
MNEPVAAIAGVAESDLGITGKTALELLTQASLTALDEAGLTLEDVDGLATAGVSRMPTIQVAEYFGIQPRWTDGTMVGGSSFEVFVGHAAEAVRRGLAETVLVCYGSNQRSAKSRRYDVGLDPALPSSQFDAPYGPLMPSSLYALAAQRHMHEFGTTSEQLAEVAVAARQWALLNPKAYRHNDGPLTVEDVLNSKMISSPLHSLDYCLITDGGGAAVVTTIERARDLAQRPVVVLGHGEATTHFGLSQMPDLTATGAYDSSRRAYEMADIGPDDVDVAELYDSFTITTMLTLEALGFCGRGESGSFVEKGRIAPGGEFPLNTSGGGLSYCHPGMYGLLLVVEAIRQLRGEGGERQIEGAEIAVAHGTGGILSSHSTVLFGVDR